MTVPDAFEILGYWKTSPPEHEMLAMFAQIYTTWTPGGEPMTEEEARVKHQRSLEQRWAAGAMSAKDLVGSLGAERIL
jgi:hypothetical protein